MGLLGNGNGGAILVSGYDKEVSIDLCGVRMDHNGATGVGGAIYFGGYKEGSLEIRDSVLLDNTSRVETGRYPGIFTTEKIFVKVTRY